MAVSDILKDKLSEKVASNLTGDILGDVVKQFAGKGLGDMSSVMKSSGLDGIAKQFGGSNVLSNAFRNLKDVGLKGGGQYIEAAAKGAAVGAGAGGVSEWTQGGSFFGGAKRGILPGAALGMGGRAFQVGAGGEQWKQGGGFRGAAKIHQQNYREGHTAGAKILGEQLNNKGISKPLEAILLQEQNRVKGKNVYGG